MLGLAIAAIIGYAIYNQSQSIMDTVSVGFKSIKFKSVDLTGIQFNLLLSLENRGNAAVNIDAVDGSISDNQNNQIGTFISGKLAIEPRATTNLLLNIRVSNLSAAWSIYNAFKKGAIPDLLIKGGVQTNLLGRIPFDYTYSVASNLNLTKKWTGKRQ